MKSPLASRKKLSSCVRPGVLLTNARRAVPTNALIALDLPALERPANAISARSGGGRSASRLAEKLKTA